MMEQNAHTDYVVEDWHLYKLSSTSHVQARELLLLLFSGRISLLKQVNQN